MKSTTKGTLPNCGFCHGGCSHTGDLSHTELKMRCDDLRQELMYSKTVYGPLLRAHDLKRYAAKTRSRIATYANTAKAYLSISTRDRTELSKIEEHAMLRWEEERTMSLRKLELQDVNMKRLMLTTFIQHFCDLCLLNEGPHA